LKEEAKEEPKPASPEPVETAEAPAEPKQDPEPESAPVETAGGKDDESGVQADEAALPAVAALVLPKTDAPLTVDAPDVDAADAMQKEPKSEPVQPETIIIADEGLKKCIGQALSNPGGGITPALAAELTELSCSSPDSAESDVKDLSGIENFTNLAKLDLSYNQIVDMTPLTNLPKLESLNLRSNKISDIGSVTKIPSQCEIDLVNNPIQDIGPLLMRKKQRK